MRWSRVAAIYGILIGFIMIIMWVMFYLTAAIPEIQFQPWEIYLHITAEMFTAVLLLLGGYGMIKHRVWGRKVHLFSLGMLVYSVIASSGYYVQQGDVIFTIMFGVILMLSILFAFMETIAN